MPFFMIGPGGLTALPTKDPSSIGIEKTDNLPSGVTPDLRFYTSAAELEAIKTAVVQVCAEMGLTDGSTVGSIVARVKAMDLGASPITVDFQTLNATPTVAMSIPIPTGKMFKVRIELVAADASGGGSGGGEIQIFGVNVGGTPAGLHTFGDDHSFTGSMAAVVNPTFAGAAGVLQVLVTGVAATTVNWLLVATVRPLRSLT